MNNWTAAAFEDFGTVPVEVDVYLDTYYGPAWEVSSLRYRSGWLMVSRASMETHLSEWTSSLVACVDDDGEQISPWLASKFFDMRCSLPRELSETPPVELEIASDALYWDFLGTCDLKHLAMLEEAETTASREIARLEARGETILEQSEAYLASLRAWMRRTALDDPRRKLALQRIALIEDKQRESEIWIRERAARVRNRLETYEAGILDLLLEHGEVEHFYTVHWSARHSRDRREDVSKLPAWRYEQNIGFAPGHFERSVLANLRFRWRGPNAADTLGSRKSERISAEAREGEITKALAEAAEAAARRRRAVTVRPTPVEKRASETTRERARLTKQERQARQQEQLARLREHFLSRAKQDNN